MDHYAAIQYIFDRQDEWKAKTIYDFLEWKKDHGRGRQSWRLINADTLIAEWKYNFATGLVHDNIIQKFQEICVENYVRLHINTVLYGHESVDPFSYMEDVLPEEMTRAEFEELLDDIDEWAVDNEGSWRISDFAFIELNPLVYGLLETDDMNEKLYYTDRILNVIHLRGDLSAFFVKGGWYTLSQLSELSIAHSMREDNNG